MSKSDAYELDLLKLLFNGTPIANICDNAASSPATQLYVALHTADPTDAGNQSTNEVSYTGYSRLAVARSAGGWTVSQTSGTTSVSPTSTLSFPQSTQASAPPTATYASIGLSASGATKYFYSGALSTPISCANGVTPQLSTSTSITED